MTATTTGSEHIHRAAHHHNDSFTIAGFRVYSDASHICKGFYWHCERNHLKWGHIFSVQTTNAYHHGMRRRVCVFVFGVAAATAALTLKVVARHSDVYDMRYVFMYARVRKAGKCLRVRLCELRAVRLANE